MKEESMEKVPVFRTWKHWYLLLAVVLLAEIIIFILFTKHFS